MREQKGCRIWTRRDDGEERDMWTMNSDGIWGVELSRYPTLQFVARCSCPFTIIVFLQYIFLLDRMYILLLTCTPTCMIDTWTPSSSLPLHFISLHLNILRYLFWNIFFHLLTPSLKSHFQNRLRYLSCNIFFSYLGGN